ncbi:MAG: hypothetical protein JXR81_10175 [Candidatus Goldbacteria bacterium]|nr:hypothetical protein [Candidatus Goldiibacteriota bacterium]
MGKQIGILVITASILIAVNCSRHQSPAAVTDIELYLGSVTVTNTFSSTFIPTYSHTDTFTSTNTYTNTPTETATITPTFTDTFTGTNTYTNTPAKTFTITPTFTATSSATPYPTPIATSTNIGAVEGGAWIHGTMGHPDSNCNSCDLSLNCMTIELIPLGWKYTTECPGSGTSYGFINVPVGTYTVLGHTIVVTDGGEYTVPHYCENFLGCPNF